MNEYDTFRALKDKDYHKDEATRKTLGKNLRNIINPFPGISGLGVQNSSDDLEDRGRRFEISADETTGKRRIKSIDRDGYEQVTDEFDPEIEERFWRRAEGIKSVEEERTIRKTDKVHRRLQQEVYSRKPQTHKESLEDVARAHRNYRRIESQIIRTAQRRFNEGITRVRRDMGMRSLVSGKK